MERSIRGSTRRTAGWTYQGIDPTDGMMVWTRDDDPEEEHPA